MRSEAREDCEHFLREATDTERDRERGERKVCDIASCACVSECVFMCLCERETVCGSSGRMEGERFCKSFRHLRKN